MLKAEWAPVLLSLVPLAVCAAEDSTAAAALRAGKAAIAARDSEAAAAAFARACALAPGEADACYYAGRTFHMLGDFEEARRALEQALAHAPDEGKAKIHRAAALNFVALGQVEAAEVHFQAAVRLHSDRTPGPGDPRVDYGAFLVRQGRPGDALRQLEQAVKAKADSPRAHAELGKALLDSGKPEAAARSLARAVALDPSAWAVRLILGRTYQQLGRALEAERELALGRKGWSREQGAGAVSGAR
jgi:tetratricopeptide (TPR) repeat protein